MILFINIRNSMEKIMISNNKKNIVRFIGIKQYFPTLQSVVIVKRFFITSVLLVPLLANALYYYPNALGSNTGSSATALSPTDSYLNAYGLTIYSLGVVYGGNAVYLTSGRLYYLLGAVGNVAMPSCQSGATWDGLTQTCKFPPLNTFDNNSSGCSKAGGYFMSTGTEQVGGTTYGASFFGGAGIQLGGSLKATTKCGTLGDLAGQMATTALGLVPFASKLFGSAGLKKLANLAWIDKLQKYNQTGGFADIPSTPKAFNDTVVGLPKVNPTPGGKPSVPITESAVPSTIKPGDTTPTPTRAPTITPDQAYAFVQGAHIPTRANGDVVFDESVVQLVNDFNTVSKDLRTKYLSDPVTYSYLAPSATVAPTTLTQVIPKTFTYTAPVKETIDLSKYVTSTPTPSTIATYTGVTNLSHSVEGTTPIDTYTTTKTFPDGSSSVQAIRIVPSTSSGSMKTTTLSYDGVSNTTTVPISVSGYISPSINTVPDNVTIQITDGSTVATTNTNPATPTTITNPDTTTTTVYPDGSTVTKNATGTVISSTPATIATPANSLLGQDASTIINAVMPDYVLNENSSFIDFATAPITSMIDDSSLMFTNIKNQLASVKTSFDNTKAMLDGNFTPPVYPAGSCGTALSFDVFRKHIDLCPPLVTQTSKFSPIVEPLTAIGGTVIAVTIILGGM